MNNKYYNSKIRPIGSISFVDSKTGMISSDHKERGTNKPNIKDINYIFCWGEIPRNDSGRLRNFLIHYIHIDWVKQAKIEKIDNNKIIQVSTEKNYLLLKLNNEKTKLYLKIDEVEIVEFIAKKEKNKLNIYITGDSIIAFWRSEYKTRRKQNSPEDIRKSENIKRVRELADKLFK